MKRLSILAITLLCSAPLTAKSLKQRINALEEKVALLARNEEESWKELKRMDRELSRFEEREINPEDNETGNSQEKTDSND